jgi:hypothetical protein
MQVMFLNQSGLGLNFLMRALHYNQYTAVSVERFCNHS